MALGNPIRSIVPVSFLREESPDSKSANLMLDEPPLMVRMFAFFGFMNGFFIILGVTPKALSQTGFIKLGRVTEIYFRCF
jgi:hypothetical protein